MRLRTRRQGARGLSNARRWACTGGVSGALLLTLIASPAAAGTLEAAAQTTAKELATGLTDVGLPLQFVLVSSFRAPQGPQGDDVAAKFEAALQHALTKDQGVQLIDRAALKATLEELALSNGEMEVETLTEVAGGLGAKVLIIGTINAVGEDCSVNAKAVAATDGAVIAVSKATFTTRASGESSEEMLSLQAQLRRLSDELAAGLDQLAGEARYQRFAVLPFDEIGETTKEKQLGLLVSAELTTLLQRDHNLMMVERGQLTRVIDEMALSQTGLVDESQSMEIGKLAGAQALVIGSVSHAGDRYLANAKVVATESGQVVVAAQIPLPAADLVALSSEAVVLRSTTGAVYRSVLLPGWGQFYNRQPVKAGIFIGAETLAAALALTFYGLSANSQSQYDALGAGTSADQFRALRSEVRDFQTTSIIFAVAIAGVHLVNVLDAYLSGKSFESATIGTSTGALSTGALCLDGRCD